MTALLRASRLQSFVLCKREAYYSEDRSCVDRTLYFSVPPRRLRGTVVDQERLNFFSGACIVFRAIG